MPNGGRRSPLCVLRESPPARLQLDALAAADPRFTRLWEACIWVVLRDYTKGTPVPGRSSVFTLRTLDFLAAGYPTMLVIYAHVEPHIVEVIEVHQAPG